MTVSREDLDVVVVVAECGLLRGGADPPRPKSGR